MRLNTSDGPLNLLCVYAPTLTAPDGIKDSFYNQLETTIKGYQKQEALIILGDFNAQVGDDYEALPNCLGHFGVGKCNDNGQRLLELCSYHELCITNTFFSTKPHHRVSWRHPRSKQWHQLDVILARPAFLKNFRPTRSYHSADCDTDHSTLCSKLRLEPNKCRGQRLMSPRPDIQTFQPTLKNCFLPPLKGTMQRPQLGSGIISSPLCTLLHSKPLERRKVAYKMTGMTPTLLHLTHPLHQSERHYKLTRTSHLQHHSKP